jgi:long-chain acyl-CoA synthetase
VAFPVGDSQKYIAAIIVPNFEEFMTLFEQKGIAYDKSQVKYYSLNGVDVCGSVGQDFVGLPLLKELVDKEVERINSELESYERIKKYIILNRRFTEISGEMTPTLKVKRKVVINNLNDEIQKLFS